MTRAELIHGPQTVRLQKRTGETLTLAEYTAPLVPPYHATPYLPTGHLQTIFTTITPSDPFPLHYLRRHHTNPSDGGHFAVDYVTPTETPGDPDLPPRTRHMTPDEQAAQDTPTDDTTPMVIALHGLTGGSHELYLRAVLAPLVQRGWAACVVNARGCARSHITSPQLFNAMFTGDVRLVVRMLRRRHPRRRLCAVGFSLGANILTNYLGEEGAGCELAAAAVVSNPWDLLVADHAMHRSFLGHNVYSRALGGNLRRMWELHREGLRKHPLLREVDEAGMVYPADFDREITAKVFGFRTVGEYYRAASSVDRLLDVRTPLLVVQSRDDPVVGEEPLPWEEVRANRWVVMAVTAAGGHLGWFEGWDGRGRWFAKPVGAFFEGLGRGEVEVADGEKEAREELDEREDIFKDAKEE